MLAGAAGRGDVGDRPTFGGVAAAVALATAAAALGVAGGFF